MTKEFALISEEYVVDFNRVVTKHLNSGWCLYGQTYYANGFHRQAMVRGLTISFLTGPE
jgi:hypothetical protein